MLPGAPKQQHACLWPGFIREVKFLSPSQLAGFGLLGDVSLLAAIYVATGFWGIQASCVLIGLYTLDIRVGWEWGMEAPFPTTIDPLVSSGWVL